MKATRSYMQRGTPDCPITVGRYIKGRRLPKEPHYHPEVEIAYVRSGHSQCLLENNVYPLSQGDILILSPGQTHQYLSLSPDADIWYLIFSLDAVALPHPHVFQQEFVQPLKDGLFLLPQLLQPEHPAYDAVVEILKKINTLTTFSVNHKINRYIATVSICSALLPWCTRSNSIFHDVATNLPANAVIRTARIYIRNRYYEPLTLQMIADQVHLNPSYLSTLFKTHTGQTVMQFLIRTRIDAAVYLLRNSDLNVSQIAEKAGFHSESAFYHQFQKLMGTSPRAFRQAMHSTNTHQDGQ